VYEGRAAVWPISLAGVAAGFASLFRYDVGVTVATAEVLCGSIFFVAQPSIDIAERLRRATKFALFYAAGFAVPVLPVVIAYLLAGVAADFWFDIVYATIHYYVPFRATPLPAISFKSIGVYLPIPIWICALLYIAGPLCRLGVESGEPYKGRCWAALQLLILAVLLFLKGIVRIGPGLITSSMVSLVLLAVVATPETVRNRVTNAVAMICVLVVGCFTAVLLGSTLFQSAANLQWAKAELLGSRADGAADGSCHPTAGLERLACLKMGKDNIEAVRYVQTHTSPEDYLFVGNGRHDRIFANNVLFYFLANRRPATKWHHFDPGLQTSAEIQREMIKDLEARRPPVVVRDLGFDLMGTDEPNASVQSSHVTLLDDYLHANYREERRIGFFISVLTRLR